MRSLFSKRSDQRWKNFLLTHRLFDYAVIVRNLIRVHWFNERPSAFVSLKIKNVFINNWSEIIDLISKKYLDFFQKLMQKGEFTFAESLHIHIIDGVVLLTVGTNILVDEISLALKNSNAFSVEPILTFIAAYVESRRKIIKFKIHSYRDAS